MANEQEGLAGTTPATRAETGATHEGTDGDLDTLAAPVAEETIMPIAEATATHGDAEETATDDDAETTAAHDYAETTTTHGVGAATAAATGDAAEVTATTGNVETPATDTTTATTALPDAHEAVHGAARDANTPSTPDNVRLRDALEAIKTAIVWLVVIQILTILSPLLRVSLKWTLIVGLILILGGIAVAAVAYRKATRAQRSLPE